MSYYFEMDSLQRTARRRRNWYRDNLMHVLQAAKEKQARGIDQTIAMAVELEQKLNVKLDRPDPIPPHDVEPLTDINLMKPIDQATRDIFYKSTERGGDTRYLKERYKKIPEDRFNYRICANWDYGWQQKSSRMLGGCSSFGREAILRETFYRNNGVGPDPQHYAYPYKGAPRCDH